MQSEITDIVRLKHILDAVKDIKRFIKNTDYQEFESNKMLQSACIHQLEIIGEAAKHFSDEFFKRYQDVEWAEIVGLRNLLIHEYFGIDLKIVWQVIQNDLPKLKKNINQILKELT
jgi:uncharacterized protein with HEPN domain